MADQFEPSAQGTVKYKDEGDSFAPVVEDSHYGTPSESAVSVGSSSTSVLSANTSRRYLHLVNDSDTDIYISFAGAAALNTGTLLKSGGGSVVFDRYVPTSAVSAICSATGKNLLVVEG